MIATQCRIFLENLATFFVYNFFFENLDTVSQICIFLQHTQNHENLTEKSRKTLRKIDPDTVSRPEKSRNLDRDTVSRSENSQNIDRDTVSRSDSSQLTEACRAIVGVLR